jgi:hypothetical protein
MAADSPFQVTCDRCGAKSARNVEGPGDAMAQSWSRFEVLREDGETIYYLTVCPECLTEAEEPGVWPKPSPGSRQEAL